MCIRDRVRLLRNIGQKVKYYHEVKGFNHRLDTCLLYTSRCV